MKYKSDIEYKDISCPIKPSFIVREPGNTFILWSIFYLPTAGLLMVINVTCKPYTVMGIPNGKLGGAYLMAGLLIWLWPFQISKIFGSKWLLKVIQYYVDSNNMAEAKRIAKRYAKSIRYRDFKNNPWFQAFLIQEEVEDSEEIFATYFARIS